MFSPLEKVIITWCLSILFNLFYCRVLGPILENKVQAKPNEWDKLDVGLIFILAPVATVILIIFSIIVSTYRIMTVKLACGWFISMCKKIKSINIIDEILKERHFKEDVSIETEIKNSIKLDGVKHD